MKNKNTCEKCGVIHDVELAGGHDLIEADKVLRCECSEYPNDEFCQIINENKEDNARDIMQERKNLID